MEQHNQIAPPIQPESAPTNATNHVFAGDRNGRQKVPKGLVVAVVTIVVLLVLFFVGYWIYSNFLNRYTPYAGVQKVQLIYIKVYDAQKYHGEAVRERTSKYQRNVVVAELPEPPPGSFYQVWSTKGFDAKTTPLGKMEKKGSVYQFENQYFFKKPATGSWDDLSNTIVVSLEKVDDNTIEEPILQGTFPRPE